MRVAKIIRWNLGLVVAICLYGILTDEPYWRDVGHGPDLYDYFFWFALAINGPSGFLADYLSRLTGTNDEAMFLIQFALWCVLLWPQWRLYDWFVAWSRESHRKQVTFYIFVSLLVMVGGLATYEAWLYGHRPYESEGFMDKYFLFVRVGGVACSGLVLLVYSHLVANHALTLRSSGTAQKRAAP
jgi:hypothetical protein